MKRWILALVLAGVAAVAGGVFFLSRNLDHIVAEQIEVRGGAALGTAVRVGSVELDLREGRGRLRDLRVANPPGFSGGDVLSLGSVSLAIDAQSALAVASGRSRHLIIDEEPDVFLHAADFSVNRQPGQTVIFQLAQLHRDRR